MTSPHANLRLPRAAHGAALTRDVTWGRIVFVPPALVSPRLSFEPLGERPSFFAPLAKARNFSSR